MEGKHTATQRFEVLGVSDDRDFCECCGKQGLKRVVFIQDHETGDIKHFGTTCAASPVKGFGVDKEIKNAISRFESRSKVVSHMAYREYKKRGGQFGPMNRDTGVFPILNRPMYDSIRAEINARNDFNY